jgi:hypothetical protein
MKTISIRIALLAAFIGSAQGLAAEPQPVTFHDRMLLDIGPNALVPSDQPAGLGGSLGFGLAFRDFNLFLRGTGMIAEPGLNQRTLIIPTLRTEARIHILPNFITLLPYFDAGGIMTKVRIDAEASLSSDITSLYAELGIGVEMLISHEISFIPRIGVAHALLYAEKDSNNFSGPSVSMALRYTFGRTRALDF